MGSRSRNDNFGDGASPGKIFIGGLHKDTTNTMFNKHFGKYGEITDSVIMRDRLTGQPRGFGFITYADPSVVDKVIEDSHVFNGKQVEIKRTIPKGGGGNQPKDFKTKKIFVGGIPSTVTDDELKDFFAKYGNVVEHQIIRDHETNRSRGFGFVIFDSEEVVDELLSKGNMIDMADSQVEIKKAEPKKPSNRSPPSFGSHPRGRSFNNSYGGYGGPYGGFDGGYGPPGPIRSYGGPANRFAGGYGYGRGGVGPEYGGGYGGYGGGSGSLGGYRNEPPIGYSSRFGPYGSGGYGGEGYGNGGYGGAGGGGGGYGAGGYGRGGGEGYGGYGGAGYGGAFESGGSGGSYEGSGGPYGRGYSNSSRYHPYAR